MSPSFLRSSVREIVFLLCVSAFATAQASVTTYHYDNSRMGQNTARNVPATRQRQ